MPVCAFVDACVAQRLERVRDVLGFCELDGLVVKIGDYGRSVVLLDCVDYLRGHFCDSRELYALLYMVFNYQRTHRRVLVVVRIFAAALVFGKEFRLNDFPDVVVERAYSANHRICRYGNRRVFCEERHHYAVVVGSGGLYLKAP